MGAAAIGADGRIFALGGQAILPTTYLTLPTLEACTPSTGAWSTLASMPTKCQQMAAVTGADGRIYAIGGADLGDLATVEAYTP